MDYKSCHLTTVNSKLMRMVVVKVLKELMDIIAMKLTMLLVIMILVGLEDIVPCVVSLY